MDTTDVRDARGARLLGGTPTTNRATASVANVAVAALLLVLLPPLVYYFWICLDRFQGRLVIPTRAWFSYFPWPTATSVGMVAGWLLFQGLLQIYAPGRWVEGTPLLDGRRLRYKLNGWASWWTTWAVLAAGVAGGLIPATILADQFGPLLTTVNIVTYLFAFYLYFHGRRRGTRSERVTGNPVYDFWLGTALNPRVGNFDLKLFFEARPGLIGWVAIDLSFAAKQLAVHGRLTTPMILVCAFHFFYVADYYFHEEAILTTFDIKHEKFGWMLAWGDLVWVPFTYTIQAQYLVHHTHELTGWQAVGLVALKGVGFAIFRGANIQKHRFRKDPTRPIWGKPPESIVTARGSLLLTSGWWGLARHANYFGDLLMAWAWCLPCGFGSPLPYFYVVYFTILLVHRERRDNAICQARYGEDWDRYREKVPWRIIPGVY
jgi:protein-S-isoprenylcysteine O-methyltransferase Ste14